MFFVNIRGQTVPPDDAHDVHAARANIFCAKLGGSGNWSPEAMHINVVNSSTELTG
jgi:hypothetical protein